MLPCDAFAKRPRDWDLAEDTRIGGHRDVLGDFSYVRHPSQAILSASAVHEVISMADELCMQRPELLALCSGTRDDSMLPASATTSTAFMPAYRPMSADFPVVLSDLTPLTSTWSALCAHKLGVSRPTSLPSIFRNHMALFFGESFTLKAFELKTFQQRKPTAVFARTSAPVAEERRAALRVFWSENLVSPLNTGPFVLASTAVYVWHAVLLDAFSAWLDPLQPRVHQAFITGRMLSCGYLSLSRGPQLNFPVAAPSFTASAALGSAASTAVGYATSAFPGSAVAPTAVASTAVAPNVAVFSRDREYPGSLVFHTEPTMSGDEEILDYEPVDEADEAARQLLLDIETACPEALHAAYSSGRISF
ncbi:unnamed protein product, partial [Ectocarpus sp. 12 AP-2014]